MIIRADTIISSGTQDRLDYFFSFREIYHHKEKKQLIPGDVQHLGLTWVCHNIHTPNRSKHGLIINSKNQGDLWHIRHEI